MKHKDILGKGLLAFWKGDKDARLVVDSNIVETEEWPVELFFRDYDTMPKVEQMALELAKGAVLDIGAGAGSHALWLQQRGLDATAIDISEGAVEVMQARGVGNVFREDFFRFDNGRYNTLLMLMNGIGIVGTLERLDVFFEHARQLLLPEGKILLDSSDILYLFEDDDDGSVVLDLNASYYGALEYTFSFNGETGAPFEWLFVDFDTLAGYAQRHGFSCKKLYEDEHYLYLAELCRMDL